MINLIAFLCSLCINFGAIDIPISYYQYNQDYETILNTCLSALSNHPSESGWAGFEHKYYILVRNDYDSTWEVLMPRELNQAVSSSYWVNSFNYTTGVSSIGSSQWTGYAFRQDNFAYKTYLTGFNANSHYYFLNPDNDYQNNLTNARVLCYIGENYVFPYDNNYLVDFSPPPPVISGHSSGFSDLIEDVNGTSYTVLGHSNNGINNSNSFDLVTVSSGLSDKLLAAIGRLLSGINDSLSYGQGTLIGIGSLILTHILDVKNWLFEPVDPDLLQYRWGHSAFGTLVDTINIDFNGHAYNPNDLVFRWNLSSIPYFENCVGSYDLSSALDPTKYIWQPLLITLLYASLCWGFIRSIPNIIGGVSPISNNHIQGPKDTPKTSKGG